MKYYFLLFLIPQLSFSEIITECGEYSVRGIVRAKDDGLKLIVNEKTQSEYVVSMSTANQGQIGNFLDTDVTVELILNNKKFGQNLMASKVIHSKKRIPKPLTPSDTGFTLLKKIPCSLIE